MSAHQVTVVPHTHWDREWYQPLSVFQARLVETVDRVLELLEGDPEFSHFMLDGQAVVLEDYLSSRPEAEDRIRRHVQSGRLAIGPWYTLADEFLASPESLVRNLALGMKTCRRFGEPMSVVYTPDPFGHVSFLPRLALGFGFDSIVFERGVGDEGERLRGEFRWRTADGDGDVLTVHLLGTYASAAAIGYRDWEAQDRFEPELALAHARKALFGEGELLGIPEWLDASFERIHGGTAAYATGRHLLLLNGSDHLPPQANLPEVVELLNQRVPEARFEIGPLRRYIDGVISEAGRLEEFAGEFRGSRYHHILSGVFSSRIYLKQANHRAQLALERYAEPISALAFLEGARYPDAVIESAWRTLLRNHAHDSICGCSIDAVHDEMVPRFKAVSDAADHVSGRGLAHLAGEVVAGGALTAFNPLPRPWRGVLRARLQPEGGIRLGGLAAADGTPLPASIEPFSSAAPGDARRTVEGAAVAWLAELPPLSVVSFLPLPPPDEGRAGSGAPAASAGGAAPPAEAGAGRIQGHRLAAEPSPGAWRLENELLLAALEGDRLELRDKRRGGRASLRLALVDEADAGDEYDFSPVPGDREIVWRLGELPLRRADPDPFTETLRLEGKLALPERLSEDRRRRQGNVSVPVAIELTLAAGDPYLSVEVRVDNRAEDHRLRLRCEADIAAERLAVEGHFDVIERPTLPAAARGWFQSPSGTNHQGRFLAVGDGRRGLAILNAGLPEYAAQSAEHGTRVEVTLLRCVGWLSRNDLISRPQGAGPALPTPGAQCLGEHRFALALAPYSGRWDEAGVPALADRFAAPPLVAATRGAAPGLPFLELPEGLLLSALLKADEGDGVLVRLWNPGTERVQAPLRLRRAPVAARVVELDGSPVRDLEPAAEIPLSMRPKELLTIELFYGGDAMG